MVARVTAFKHMSSHGLDAGGEEEWRHRGTCGHGEYDPNLWTSPNNSDLGQARWVCLRECPVQRQCSAWAAAHPEQAEGAVYGGYYYVVGRWGRDNGRAGAQPVIIRPGTIPVAVRPERTATGGHGRRRESVCGTYGGFKSHKRDRTEPCQACMEAYLEYGRSRRLAS